MQSIIKGKRQIEQNLDEKLRRKQRIWRRINKKNYQPEEKSLAEYRSEEQQQKQPVNQENQSTYFINRLRESSQLIEEKARLILLASGREVKKVNQEPTKEGWKSALVDMQQMKRREETLACGAQLDSTNEKVTRSSKSLKRVRKRNGISLLLLILSFSSLTIIYLLPSSCLASNLKSKSEDLNVRYLESKVEDAGQKQVGIVEIRSKRSVSQYKSGTASDEISSADLPAEFRSEGGGGIRKEQSRLARLCEQTSSVLASVLPAPFGGHKRSILCQFFGQVPEPGAAGPPSTLGAESQNHNRLPESIESVAVLQQAQQPPITSMLAAGRHPIQLVLEQQRLLAQQQQQQQQLANLNARNIDLLKGAASVIDYSYQQRLEPPPAMRKLMLPPGNDKNQLVGSNNQEKVVKFIPTFSIAPLKPITAHPTSSQLVSTSGWRIFDSTKGQNYQLSTSPEPPSKHQEVKLATVSANNSGNSLTSNNTNNSETLRNVNTREKAAPDSKSSTTSSLDLMKQNEDLSKASSMQQNTRHSSKNETSATKSGKEQQLLVMGRPPAPSETTSLAKRSQALKTTTRSSWTSSSTTQTARPLAYQKEPTTGAGEVRTIEVVSSQQQQQSPNTTEKSEKSEKLLVVSKQVLKADAALNALNSKDQNQHKREEMVIASINNLTRIAFGNQLRDTVKVINKLIDEQADLFSKQLGGGKSSSSTDRMLGAESVERAKLADPTSTTVKRPTEVIKSIKQIVVSTTNKPSLGSTKKPSSNARISNGRKEQVSQLRGKNNITQTSSQAQTKVTKKPKKRPIVNDSRRITPTSSKSTDHNLDAFGHSLPVYDEITLMATELRAAPTRNSILTNPNTSSIALRQDKASWRMSSAPLDYRSASTSPQLATSQRALTTQFTKPAYSWLLPDQSAFSSDLFASSSLVPIQERDDTEIFRRKNPEKHQHVSRKAGVLPLEGKQALVLNRIDGKIDTFGPSTANSSSKQVVDSLTTLKMSLSSKFTASNNQAQQSRWMPTTSLHTSTTTTSTTTKRPATNSIPTESPPTTTISTSSSDRSTAKTTQSTASEVNETRASDSISRYTSHWNDANQLLATTRRLNSVPPQQPLPVQTAQTGEFFSAETIASWPEKYQMMLGQALEASTASLPETTRRNGEVYESRHRLDSFSESNTMTPAATTTRTFFTSIEPGQNVSQSTGAFTVLPSNHKLTSSKSIVESYSDNLESTQTGKTQPLFPSTTSRPFSTVSGPAVAYTLVGPFTGESETTKIVEAEGYLRSHQPAHSLNAEDGSPNEHINRSPLAASSLRPPYIANSHLSSTNPLEPLTLQQQQQQDIIEYEGSLGKPQVARKLYELLVPSTKSFVGVQNPLNQQRFNLSAMKFLAQSLLMPSTLNTSDSSGSDTSYIGSDASLQSNGSMRSQRLVEFLGTSLPFNYYDLLLNETSAQSPTQQANSSSAKSNGSMGKSFLGRASNLLNDLRQMEHRKAAALLAAIRYQVPGPLVRPWDSASDMHASSAIKSFHIHDRLDEPVAYKPFEDDTQEELIGSSDNLLLAQAGRIIGAALRKQRLVPREMLHARLRASHNSKYKISDADQDLEFDTISPRSDTDSSLKSNSDSNVDHHKKTLKETAYSFGDTDNEAGVFNGSRHDDADYLASQDQPQVAQGISGGNLTRRWLNKLFNRHFEKIPVKLNDFDLVDPVKGSYDNLKVNNDSTYRENHKYKYSADQHAKARPITSLDPIKTSSTKADSITVSKNEATVQREKNQETRLNNKVNLDELTVAGKKESFDCSDRQSGFYPDAETACQTFYHCSSTGHLLTFNCPHQTRFDEKSLKCGPWYEVPCDLGRIKQVRVK